MCDAVISYGAYSVDALWRNYFRMSPIMDLRSSLMLLAHSFVPICVDDEVVCSTDNSNFILAEFV